MKKKFKLSQKMYIFSNGKVFFVFEDIGLKFGTDMFYGFVINIARNNFFVKINIFWLLTLLWKKSLNFVIFSFKYILKN